MGILLAALVTISGIVVNQNVPLPGATVTMSNGALSRTVVAGVEGRYAFPGVAEGAYEIRYELSGFETAQRSVTAREENIVVEPQELMVVTSETITLSCNSPRCNNVPPTTAYDEPLCSDYALNDSLMEAASLGDDSARRLLRMRYDDTLSRVERHRIGVVLDDERIWRELLAEAELCVRFPRENDEFSEAWLEWCAARSLPAEAHWYASLDALTAVADNVRARDLLRKALEANDDWIALEAIWGLAEQRDAASLPAIERRLPRFEDNHGAVLALAMFQSDAADVIAMQYLEDEHDRIDYREFRDRNEP